jgi:precorrin-2 dehydrogenase / sirohydrochlorin ferrochelatase
VNDNLKQKVFMPLCLDVRGKMVLIVGGGNVAARKLAIIRLYADLICVVAPEINEHILLTGVSIHKREYVSSDLDGVYLAYICTNNKDLNYRIGEEAQKRGVLFNICDDPMRSTFLSPAVYTRDTMSVAVSSNGENVKRSIRWRDKIKEIFDHDQF